MVPDLDVIDLQDAVSGHNLLPLQLNGARLNPEKKLPRLRADDTRLYQPSQLCPLVGKLLLHVDLFEQYDLTVLDGVQG